MRSINNRLLGGVLGLLVFLPGAQTWAAGTTAGTSVDNQASVNYDVGGISQAVINSAPGGNSTPGAGGGAATSFLVDDRIDFTVTEVGGAYTSVTPGATLQVLTYLVTNNGNRVHDFSLTNTNQAGGAGPFGSTDTFDATAVSIFVESGASAGFQSAQDTATFIDELAEDASINVYIVSTIPLTQVNGDLSVHRLTAQVAVGGTAAAQGADITTDDRAAAYDPTIIQTLFADAGNDGSEFADDGYLVSSAALTITKTSSVISDPVTDVVGGVPKAIPGAIVQYTITIANGAGAGATATNIAVSDDLSTEIGAGTIAFNADTYAVGSGIQVTAPNINGGAALGLTNTNADADGGDFTGNVVTVTGIDLAPTESATVTFRVTVQ